MRNKSLLGVLCVLCLLVLGGTSLGRANAGPSVQPVLDRAQVPILEQDGLKFKDLNENGLLDPYEDWRLSPSERAADLVSRMEYTEKTAQMIHLTLLKPKEEWFADQNVGFALAYSYLADSPREAAERANELQAWSESSRWGIPLVISMDSVIGASWVKGATLYPDQIGLAATRNVGLVRQLNEMQREEMKALGVRMSLSPIADLATEPRWGRFQECFGEDADSAAEMVVAAIEALQAGRSLNSESVLVSVKHFPGSGPQADGVDGSPILFDEESLRLHLIPFQAAIEAGAGSIMPYGYSKVPFLGGDAETRNAHESHTVMTELLVEEMGYDGLIQTDWGLKHLDAALAGAHILGGAGMREIQRLADGIAPEDIDAKVNKILEAKFQMGLFENPYVDPEYAAAFVGNEDHLQLAYQAASRSLTLLKHTFKGALTKDSTLIVGGSLAQDAESLNSGWKVEGGPGLSIQAALEALTGPGQIIAMSDDNTVIQRPADAAIFVVGEPASTHQPPWGVDNLRIPEQDMALLRAANEQRIPIISVVVLSRPYVLTELVELSDSVLVVYRPGVTMGAQAVVDALFGKLPIAGKLPVQLPRNLEQVAEQREDLPFDIINPLFDYGYGIRVPSFTQPQRQQ